MVEGEKGEGKGLRIKNLWDRMCAYFHYIFPFHF